MWQTCTVDATRPRIAVYLDGRRVQGDDRRRILAALKGAGIVIQPGQEIAGTDVDRRGVGDVGEGKAIGERRGNVTEFDYKEEYQKALGVIRELQRENARLRQEFVVLARWRNALMELISEGSAAMAPPPCDENHTVGMSAVEERG